MKKQFLHYYYYLVYTSLCVAQEDGLTKVTPEERGL